MRERVRVRGKVRERARERGKAEGEICDEGGGEDIRVVAGEGGVQSEGDREQRWRWWAVACGRCMAIWH